MPSNRKLRRTSADFCAVADKGIRYAEARGVKQRGVHDQDHDRPDRGDNEAVESDSVHAPQSEAVDQPAADDSAADAQKNIYDEALSGPIDLAMKPAVSPRMIQPMIDMRISDRNATAWLCDTRAS